MPIKLSANRASAEFNVSYSTVQRGLMRLGFQVDGKRRFTLYQIAAAIYGDGKAERSRLAAVEADLGEIDLMERWGELMPVEVSFQFLADIGLMLRESLDEMPAALSQEICPEDPSRAMPIIHRHKEGMLKAWHDAVLAFKQEAEKAAKRKSQDATGKPGRKKGRTVRGTRKDLDAES